VTAPHKNVELTAADLYLSDNSCVRIRVDASTGFISSRLGGWSD